MNLDPKNYADMFKPSSQILSQCTEVAISLDQHTNLYHKMKKWCQENNTSYIWCEMIDDKDYTVAFWFTDERDALSFTLKFT